MTGNGPNWGKLFAQGRCKDIGVPWSAEEQEALNAGVPVAYVRSGVTTKADYDAAVKADAKNGAPIERQTRDELEATAKKLKVDFSPETPTASLLNLVRGAQEGKPKRVRKPAKVGGAKVKRAAKKAK